MLVGNILLLYSEAVQCRKLLIPLSQMPRQRRAAGSQASDTIICERVLIINSPHVLK